MGILPSDFGCSPDAYHTHSLSGCPLLRGKYILHQQSPGNPHRPRKNTHNLFIRMAFLIGILSCCGVQAEQCVVTLATLPHRIVWHGQHLPQGLDSSNIVAHVEQDDNKLGISSDHVYYLEKYSTDGLDDVTEGVCDGTPLFGLLLTLTHCPSSTRQRQFRWTGVAPESHHGTLYIRWTLHSPSRGALPSDDDLRNDRHHTNQVHQHYSSIVCV